MNRNAKIRLLNSIAKGKSELLEDIGSSEISTLIIDQHGNDYKTKLPPTPERLERQRKSRNKVTIYIKSQASKDWGAIYGLKNIHPQIIVNDSQTAENIERLSNIN